MKSTAESASAVRDIGWDEMDKTKYYMYGPSLFFLVRASLHPFALVKTRLQMQRSITNVDGSHHMVQYAGTIDAFRKIVRYEGFLALYKGFGVSTVGMIAGQLYITSYEVIRMYIVKMNEKFGYLTEKNLAVARNAVAGGTASLMSQMIVVPVDVISQKRMMYTGLAQRLPGGCTGGLSIPEMSRDIFQRDGVRGFYKGFGASLAVNAPSSAIWWGTYGYCREYFFRLAGVKGVNTQMPSSRALEALAGASAGIVSTILTNPMDVARTRLQVDGRVKDGSTLFSTGYVAIFEGVLQVLGLRVLWVEEGPRSMMKGVNARLMAAIPSSIMVITVYELVKRLSKKDTVKHKERPEPQTLLQSS